MSAPTRVVAVAAAAGRPGASLVAGPVLLARVGGPVRTSSLALLLAVATASCGRVAWRHGWPLPPGWRGQHPRRPGWAGLPRLGRSLPGVERWRRSRRAARRDGALPAVLESVARSLRAGSSLSEAVASVEPPPPLEERWSRLVERARLAGVAHAARAWADEEPVPSVRLAAGALALGAEVGGAHARALDGVGATLRARQAVAEEVRALSSQARVSALVIGLAPAGFCAFAAATDPSTARFYRSPAGIAVLVAGLVLDALGAMWMARITRVAEP